MAAPGFLRYLRARDVIILAALTALAAGGAWRLNEAYLNDPSGQADEAGQVGSGAGAIAPKPLPPASAAPPISSGIHPKLVLQFADDGDVMSLAFLPGGRTLVTASLDCSVKLWDEASQRVRQALYVTSPVDSVCPSGNGRTLWCGCDDAGIREWEIGTGQMRRVYKYPHQSPAGHRFDTPTCSWLSLSADGSLLAAGYQTASGDALTGPSAVIWDTRTGKPRITISVHGMRHLALSPRGDLLATGDLEGHVDLWDTTTGQRTNTLDGGAGRILLLAFSADGSQLTSVGSDAIVRRWDPATGRLLKTFKGRPSDLSELFDVALSNDGETLAWPAWDGSVHVWHLSTDRRQRLGLKFVPPGNAIAFSPDGHTVVVAGDLGELVAGSVATGDQTWHVKALAPAVRSAAFSPDGRYLVAVGNYGLLYSADRSYVTLWDLTTGKLTTSLVSPGLGGAVAFSPDGRDLFAGRPVAQTLGQGELSLLGMPHLSEQRVWRTSGRGSIDEMALSPDGRTLATAGLGSPIPIDLWDAHTGRLLRILAGHEADYLAGLEFSSDGKTLMSYGIADSEVKLWDVDTGKLRRAIDDGSYGHQCAALAPAGHLLATGGAGGFRIWDWSTGKPLRTFKPSDSLTVALAFSHDGETLAQERRDGRILLWHVETWTVREEMQDQANSVNELAFTKDGGTLVSYGLTDGSLRLWNPATGKLRATLYMMSKGQSETSPLEWLALTPEGYYARSKGATDWFCWRVGHDVYPGKAYDKTFNRPDLVARALKSRGQRAATTSRSSSSNSTSTTWNEGAALEVMRRWYASLSHG